MNVHKLALGLAAALCSTAFAQLSLTTPFVAAPTITFDGTVAGVSNGQFAGSGFAAAPTAGQLDSDAWAVTGFSDGNLAFGGTADTGDLARGTFTTARTFGGLYAFGSTDRQLLIQPIDADFTPGTLTLRMVNDMGKPMTAFSFSFERYIRNDQARSNSFNFTYSTDGTSFTSLGLPLEATYSSTELADANGWALQATVSGSVTLASPVSAGSFFYVRWDGNDVSGIDNRDEFGIDDFSITPVPEPATYASLAGLAISVVVLLRRRSR